MEMASRVGCGSGASGVNDSVRKASCSMEKESVMTTRPVLTSLMTLERLFHVATNRIVTACPVGCGACAR
eukprot:1029308-Prymnesium_polylepis.1